MLNLQNMKPQIMLILIRDYERKAQHTHPKTRTHQHHKAKITYIRLKSKASLLLF